MISKNELIDKLKYGSHSAISTFREIVQIVTPNSRVVNLPTSSRYSSSSILVIKDSRSSAYLQTYEPWDGIDMRTYNMKKDFIQLHRVTLQNVYRSDLLSYDYFQNPDLYWWILYSNKLFDDAFVDTSGNLIEKILIIKNYYNPDGTVN